MIENFKKIVAKNSDMVVGYIKHAIVVAISLIGFFAMFGNIYAEVSLKDLTTSMDGYSLFSLMNANEFNDNISIFAIIFVIIAVVQILPLIFSALDMIKLTQGKKSNFLSIALILSLVLHFSSLIPGAMLLFEINAMGESPSAFMTQICNPILLTILLTSIYFLTTIYQNDKKDIYSKTSIHKHSPMTGINNLFTVGALSLSACSLILPIVQMSPSIFRSFDIVYWLTITGKEDNFNKMIAIIAFIFAIVAIFVSLAYVMTQYIAVGKKRETTIPIIFTGISAIVNFMFSVLSMIVFAEASASAGILKTSTACFVPLMVSVIVLVAQLIYKNFKINKNILEPNAGDKKNTQAAKVNSTINGKYEA